MLKSRRGKNTRVNLIWQSVWSWSFDVCVFSLSNIYYSHSAHNYSSNNNRSSGSNSSEKAVRWYMKKVEKSLNRINAFIEIYFICIHIFFCASLSSQLDACVFLYAINIVWAHLMRFCFFSSHLFALLVFFKQNRINSIVLCDVYNFAFNAIAASFFFLEDTIVLLWWWGRCQQCWWCCCWFLLEWTWITGTEVLLRRLLYSWEWNFLYCPTNNEIRLWLLSACVCEQYNFSVSFDRSPSKTECSNRIKLQ